MAKWFPPDPVVRPESPIPNGARQRRFLLLIIKKLLFPAMVLGIAFALSESRAGSANPAGTRAPAPVPPPVSAAPALPAPPPRPEVQPRRDVALIQRLTPRVEVWRPNSNRPQNPTRRSDNGRSDPAFVTGAELVTIQLRFNPQSAGEKVRVIAARGIVLNPPQQVLTISAQGDCAFPAQLEERATSGHLIIYCRNVRTVVPLVRARAAVVQAQEAQAGGRP